MKIDTEIVLIIVLGIVAIFGMFYTVGRELDNVATCKQTAIAKNMGYLEIKELCK